MHDDVVVISFCFQTQSTLKINGKVPRTSTRKDKHESKESKESPTRKRDRLYLMRVKVHMI